MGVYRVGKYLTDYIHAPLHSSSLYTRWKTAGVQYTAAFLSVRKAAVVRA
jgi:hypothetical protein